MEFAVAPALPVARAAPSDGLVSVVAEFLLISTGVTMILAAIAADRMWFDHHSLPYMFLSRSRQLIWWQGERAAAMLFGAALIWPVRGWVAERLANGGGRELLIQAGLIAAAIVTSLYVSEYALGSAGWRRIDRWAATEEPLRQADARLGWSLVPRRDGSEIFGGRRIVYHLDARGYRVGDRAQPVDPRRSSIIFAGESIMLGFRLDWDETIAGRMQQATGLQSANLAVNGYATDQALMRLSAELPRFERPAAVVVLFAPSLIERNLDEDRPHLDVALRWHPGRAGWRVARILKTIGLYHRRTVIDRAIATTRAELTEAVREARSRQAAALILVPEFAPEQPVERMIRQRVLDDAGLPYVRMLLDPRWRLPGDGHPDARANRAMTDAVIAALRRQRPDRFALFAGALPPR